MNKTVILVGVIIIVVIIGGIYYFTKPNKTTMPAQNQQEPTSTPQDTNSFNIQGMQVQILQPGSGAEAKAGDMATVNYTGTLQDGTTFDSNTDPKFGHVQPFQFSLGAGQVIRGWDLGVAGMKVGEERKLTIPPELGYGAQGAGSLIPPNSTLIFDVTLLKIN